jgi:hypothetical protein
LSQAIPQIVKKTLGKKYLANKSAIWYPVGWSKRNAIKMVDIG